MSTASRAGRGIGVGAGCVGVCVIVEVGENGLAVPLGLGVAELGISEASSEAVGAAGAQADSINTAITSSDDQKGSRNLSSIFYLFPGCVLHGWMAALRRRKRIDWLILYHELTKMKGLLMTAWGRLGYIAFAGGNDEVGCSSGLQTVTWGLGSLPAA